jgi:hypothetical protein
VVDDPRAWQCIDCGRSAPVVSFPALADRTLWVCRQCREGLPSDRGPGHDA